VPVEPPAAPSPRRFFVYSRIIAVVMSTAHTLPKNPVRWATLACGSCRPELQALSFARTLMIGCTDGDS